MQSVYIGPSVVKYLYMEPTPKIISSIRQLCTFRWFEHLESQYRMVATAQVQEHFRAFGMEKPDDCCDLFDDLEMLVVDDRINSVASEVIPLAFADNDLDPSILTPHPIHIAAATVHQIDFLLSWDCISSHILPVIDSVLTDAGYSPPKYKTPSDMLEDHGIPVGEPD